MARKFRLNGAIWRARRLWIAATCVVLLASLLVWLAYGSGAFAVTSIDVRGATFTKVDTVKKAAAVETGSSLVAVDANEVATRVAEVRTVSEVSVSRNWPHTVVIEITERTPKLAVPKDDKFVLVDKSGVAFRTVSKVPANVVRAKLEDPGPKDPATTTVLTVLSALTPELRQQLEWVEAEAATRITLALKDSRTVFWGDGTESDRKAEVVTALLARSGEHFDVSAPDVPTVS